MAIATSTAILIGAAALGAVGAGASILQQQKASKAEDKQEKIRKQQLEAQRQATASAQAAPEKAAEKARLASLTKRRRRAKTVLTSPGGVLEPGTLEKKSLFGA